MITYPHFPHFPRYHQYDYITAPLTSPRHQVSSKCGTSSIAVQTNLINRDWVARKARVRRHVADNPLPRSMRRSHGHSLLEVLAREYQNHLAHAPPPLPPPT